MTELLQRTLPGRKDIDRHMINNVRIRTHKKSLELDSANIQIDSKHFDLSFINLYKDTTGNYTQDKYLL